MYAGSGFLGHSPDVLRDRAPFARSIPEADVHQIEDVLPLFWIPGHELRYHARLLELVPLQDQHRGIATVIENHVGWTIRPCHRRNRAFPVFREALPHPCEHRDAFGLLDGAFRSDHRCSSGMVLG